jgi:hypothetical protein
MGGEHIWRGRTLEEIHSGMYINHEDFDRYAQLYYEAGLTEGMSKD